MLQVLGKSSSINVRKVLWTCIELDVPFAQEEWGAGHRSTLAPEFLALNPNGLVPVIRDDEVTLWESNTICRYLTARHGRVDLLPVDPYGRARVEQWMDWQATELNGSWRYAFMALVRNSEQHRDRDAIARSVAAWNGNMGILDRQLAATGSFVTGADFTLADVVLGLSVHRWYATPIERPSLPAVEAYYERLSQRPGYLRYGRNGTA